MKKILVYNLLILFILSVTSVYAKQKLVTKSGKKKPDWITVPPVEKGYAFFVGSGQNADTLEDGTQTAYTNAKSSLLEYIGVYVMTKTEINTRMQGEQDLSDLLNQIRTTGQAKIKSQQIKEVYYEEYLDGERRFYDVFVLLRYSEREIQTERERMEEEQQKNRATAKEYLSSAPGLILQGNALDAYHKYADTLKILSTQPNSPLYYQSLTGLKKIIETLNLKLVLQDSRTVKVMVTCRSVDGEKSVRVNGVNVKSSFVTGTGEITGLASSDTDGIAAFKINKIKFQDGVAKVWMNVDSDQLMLPIKDSYLTEEEVANLRKLVNTKTLTVTFKITEFATRQLGLLIWTKEGKRNYDFESIFSEKLTNNGYKVIIPKSVTQFGFADYENDEFYTALEANKVDLVVLGRTDAVDQGEVYGMRSVLNKLDLRVIDVTKRQPLNSFSQSRPGVGLSKEQAVNKGYIDVVDKILPAVLDLLSIQ